MITEPSGLRSFLLWFQSNGGFVDVPAIGVSHLAGYGRGVVALKNIPEGYTLFTIPRSLTLSTRTSSLPLILGGELWKKFRLNKRWAGLILCMMWEEAQGVSSTWSQYLASLPTSFDTPMFWNENDLEELKGTSLVDSIGREDAELDYHNKIIPLVKTQPDIFPPDSIHIHYSIAQYHIMGSRILSRSFHVEEWESQDEDGENAEADISTGSGMDVDDEQLSVAVLASGLQPLDSHEGDNEDSDDEDQEDSSDIAMVPMADMLNARYGSENAKLFYEKNELKMISTKPIQAGEQIWNTYGDLPNADLLRRYGHVDLLPLLQGGEGNPGDVVDIRADLVVAVVSQQDSNPPLDSCKVKIDWWLENGGDDVFVLESNLKLPNALMSLISLLMLPDDNWNQIRDKGRIPKPKLDQKVLSVVVDVLTRRLCEYLTSIQMDEAMLSINDPQLSLNKKHAVIVRLGEKRILNATLERSQELLHAAREKENGTKLKRKDGDQLENGHKTKKFKR